MTSYSQIEWAPIGAKWHYGVLESPTTGPNQGYLIFESIKDSLIQSKKCKVINKTMHYSFGLVLNKGYEYMYSDSNKVYQLINNRFYILYDFGAKKGDHWTTRIPKGIMDYPNPEDSMRTVTVDSIGQKIVSMDTLKVLYVSIPKQPGRVYWYFKNPIVERVGGLYMFMGVWGFWDIDIPNLRCYSDNIITYKISDSVLCDAIITGIKSTPTLPDNIIAYPNPTKDHIHIDLLNNNLPLESLRLFDINGRCLIYKKEGASSPNTSVILNMEDLSNGIYFMSLCFKDSTIYKHLTIIKQ